MARWMARASTRSVDDPIVESITVQELERGLVRVHFRAPYDEAAFACYLAHLDDVLRRREPYATVIVDGVHQRMSGALRELQARWIRERAPEIGAWCVGTGFVLENALSRFVLSTIMLLVRLPCPYETFECETGALAWARARLR
jgi:hypothetical protein